MSEPPKPNTINVPRRPPQQAAPQPPQSEREETFDNPYTWVPAFARTGMTGVFGDERPKGLDRLHEDRWTGSIGVRLTVRTPLLLLDTARGTSVPGADERHLAYPVLLRGKKPHLPATSVKGMLRSAYEAVTNSRFGVFAGHDERLGWRRVADDARDMKPVRVTEDGKRLERWDVALIGFYKGKESEVSGHRPKHGERVWVKTKAGKNALEVAAVKRGGQARPSSDWREGFAFVTGENSENKKYERVFLKRVTTLSHALTPELRSRWETLMATYDIADIPDEDSGKVSPHRRDPAHRRLDPGTFCYAYCPGTRIEALYPVLIPRELAAVPPTHMIPDDVEPATSYELLSPADRVFGWVAQPAGDGKPPARPAARRGSLRVRDVTCVTGEDQAVALFKKPGLPLAILAAPKPTQSRFYLSQSAAEPGTPITCRTPKRDVHGSSDRALRGRKVYWHHLLAAQSDTYWKQPAGDGDPTQELIDGVLYREYRRPRAPVIVTDDRKRERPALNAAGTAFQTDPDEQRDTQNRTIEGWITAGTEFTFTLDVRDLHTVELGALLWLLTLRDEYHHRIGLGKPLGFGSVQLDLIRGETRLAKGEQWSRYYRDLGAALDTPPAQDIVAECVAAFEKLADAQPGLTDVRKAFLAASQGREQPVHYPRTTPKALHANRTPPNPAGQSYEWFTANEKIKDRAVVEGRGRSLPSPIESNGRSLDVYTSDS
jgi:CRISPR-associated protein (TIGR03986 family)